MMSGGLFSVQIEPPADDQPPSYEDVISGYYNTDVPTYQMKILSNNNHNMQPQPPQLPMYTTAPPQQQQGSSMDPMMENADTESTRSDIPPAQEENNNGMLMEKDRKLLMDCFRLFFIVGSILPMIFIFKKLFDPP